MWQRLTAIFPPFPFHYAHKLMNRGHVGPSRAEPKGKKASQLRQRPRDGARSTVNHFPTHKPGSIRAMKVVSGFITYYSISSTKFPFRNRQYHRRISANIGSKSGTLTAADPPTKVNSSIRFQKRSIKSMGGFLFRPSWRWSFFQQSSFSIRSKLAMIGHENENEKWAIIRPVPTQEETL